MTDDTTAFRSVDTKTAARMLSLSTSYLEKLRLYDPKNSPPFMRVGRAVRYPVDGLRAWVGARVSNAGK